MTIEAYLAEMKERFVSDPLVVQFCPQNPRKPRRMC